MVPKGDANLSSGEKSLLGICRAILRKNKIVLLDEATANIDIKTETKIQELINTYPTLLVRVDITCFCCVHVRRSDVIK